ncbi:Hydantoinase/oxoprolinase-domain-containing protein [Boeremia exigua]|uniref:Hydantoinase/oxoprolinase-domain-containing protein n=1 Tax=Boeremia exigua TaxID=749465 RepID=UPI001E8E2B07|nr:Hydantoinase/oxoprolinase-domain-containing protein [Boeremia exigua]KAH6639235.1 Hydantoinase/oxoprolinase-domain-containing protein [Boeremia exigua]
MAEGYRLGVDVGGTFTDVCVITPAGEAIRAKVPTNTADQSVGVQDGVDQVRRVLEARFGWKGRFEYVHHGTTTGTNAVLEGKGAKVGLVVTKGHKDILMVRRSQIPGGLGAWINYVQPEPLVPLERTVEAKERVTINGEVFVELDEREFRESLRDLKRQRPQAIAVSLLNSFSNNVHEEKIRGILRDEFGPDVEIVTSTDVLPEIQEYERTVTTAANAIVKPVVKTYMKNLQKKLAKDTDTLRILKSDGDLTSVDLAGEAPVRILMSGPAGGVKAVSHLVAKDTPYKNLITFDMGGTSTDCALLSGSEAIIRRETEVGSLTVRAPSVDVKTVGAGGGSIAIYNEFTKNFRVGPESSGATPGPAAYGRGGTQATVTDANLTLGYLPSKLLGGKFELDVAASAAAVGAIAAQMGMDSISAAEGIINLVNESMHGALRLVSIEQGYDPRDFALVALGGAGPMHANSLGKLLDSWPVIVPPSPGVLCAQGDAITKMSHESSCTYIKIFSEIETEDLTKTLDGLKSSCVQTMKESLADEHASLRIVYQSDMRYQGQAMTLTVDFSEDDARDASHLLEHLRAKFNKAHEHQFAFSHANVELEIMRLRVRVTDASEEVAIKPVGKAASSTPPQDAVVSKQSIIYEGKKVEATFWDREKITKAGIKIAGPAVITEMDSNTLILPGYFGEIDNMGNILIWPEKQTVREKKIHTKESAARLVQEQPLLPTLVGSALASIRREMDTLMLRCAMSPAIREQQDEFNVITNTRGQMLVGQFGSFIQQFLNGWSGSIEEGDVFVTNDVYQIDGAVSHLNDVIILVPIHYEHRLVGWAANFGHLTDVQGKVPGSMSINASTIFEDGLQIPIVKLYERGVYNEALATVLFRNSRMPNWFQSDLTALVTACRTAATRVNELCERYGVELYEAATDHLLEQNKTAIKTIIDSKIGPEKSSFTDFIDDDGQGVGPYAISCSMQKEGSKLVFDWDGTSPQSNTSMNFYLSKTMFKIFIGYYLLAIYDPHVLVNDGFHDLLDIRIPEGTILRPVRPAAVSCRTHLLGRVMDVMQALFGQRNPAYRCAAGFSDSPHLFYSGFKPDGAFYLLYQIGFGGVPARPIGDGPDCHCLFPAIKSIPAENIELYFPVIIEANEALADSGGAGYYRGGNAQRTLYRWLCEGDLSIHDDRWLVKPWGVNGGMPGSRSKKIIYRNNSYGTPSQNEHMEIVQSKMDHLHVYPGDVLEWITWGGGGLGNPLTRPPALVAQEVHRRLVTPAGARRNYGVVVRPDYSVDEHGTAALRASMARERAAGTTNGTQDGASGDTARDASDEVGGAEANEEGDRVGYNRGGTLSQLLASCKQDTGLAPPRPQWERDPYGPHTGLPYVQAWYARMRKQGVAGWDRI